jgi:hypothetical protein
MSGMRRRDFVALLGGAAASLPLAALAQQAKMARIGFLGLVSASSQRNPVAALRAVATLPSSKNISETIQSRSIADRSPGVPHLREKLSIFQTL